MINYKKTLTGFYLEAMQVPPKYCTSMLHVVPHMRRLLAGGSWLTISGTAVTSDEVILRYAGRHWEQDVKEQRKLKENNDGQLLQYNNWSCIFLQCRYKHTILTRHTGWETCLILLNAPPPNTTIYIDQ